MIVSDQQTSEECARKRLTDLAAEFYDQFDAREIPHMVLPTWTKNNIEYDEDTNAWVCSDRTSKCSTDSARGARKLLKAAYTIEFLARQLDEGHSSILRELYYISESWDNEETHFSDQDGSNKLIEDLEIVSEVKREDFHMRPKESGAKLMDLLKIREQTNHGDREIHCQLDVEQSGYQIPNNPDTVEFLEHDIDSVMCVETGGMRDRLAENGSDDDYNTFAVHLDGQSACITRRITKHLHDELDLPVVVFTDGDPWSYRIFGSVTYGSIKSAYLSEHLATPDAKFVNIQPQDIVDYGLSADPSADLDINTLRSELEDLRFMGNYWTKQIELQLNIDRKAEQQALASRGLDFVTNEYPPTYLDEMDII